MIDREAKEWVEQDDRRIRQERAQKLERVRKAKVEKNGGEEG